MSRETTKRANKLVKAMGVTNDIAGPGMILPNHSGITNHPEYKADNSIFLRLDGTNFTAGTGISYSSTVFATIDGEIDHDSLLNFVGNEHIDWTNATDNLTTTGTINTPELFNTSGDLKIQPDVQGDVVLFGDTDVGNSEDGKQFEVSRRAAEGDGSIRFRLGQFGFGEVRFLGYNNSRGLTFNNDTGGDILFQNNNGGDVTYFVNASSGQNRSIHQAGYITNGANEVEILWTVEDTDDFFHLTRENTNILGFKIEMPVIITDDLIFTGDGSGLPYGEIFTNDNTTVTSVSSAGFTQFLHFDVNGHSNLTTPDHTNDHITITKAGVYMVDCCVNIKNDSGAAHVVEIVVSKNNNATIFPNMRRHRTLGTGTDVGAIPLCGHLDLAVDDTIEVWITSDSASSRNVIGEDVILMLTMVGGT